MAAAVDAHNRAQGGEDSDVPAFSEAEFDDLLDRHAEWMASVH